MLENGNLYIVMDYCEAGNYATGCYNMITVNDLINARGVY